MKCKICKRIGFSARALAQHVSSHKLTSKEYYDQYVWNDSLFGSCPECGTDTDFRGLGVGYLEYCSQSCQAGSEKHRQALIKRKFWLSSKTPEAIAKQVAAIDQAAKTRAQKATWLKKYGVDNPTKHPAIAAKVGNAHRGTKKPRTPEWQKAMEDGRRATGPHYHSKSSAAKIQRALLALYQTNYGWDNLTKSGSKGRGHLNGTYYGVLYRSSWELLFLQFCRKNKIKVQSAENSDFRVRYKGSDGRFHFYYPDFYLPDFDRVIEIKPKSMMSANDNDKKIKAARRRFYFSVFNENELGDLSKAFKRIGIL